MVKVLLRLVPIDYNNHDSAINHEFGLQWKLSIKNQSQPHLKRH